MPPPSTRDSPRSRSRKGRKVTSPMVEAERRADMA